MTFSTNVISGYSGTKSFAVHVRVVGMPDTEMVLEADIFDREDAIVQRVEYAYDAFNQLVRRTGKGVRPIY